MRQILASHLLANTKQIAENKTVWSRWEISFEFRGGNRVVVPYGTDLFILGDNGCRGPEWEKRVKRAKALVGDALRIVESPTPGCGGTTRTLCVASCDIEIVWDVPKPHVDEFYFLDDCIWSPGHPERTLPRLRRLEVEESFISAMMIAGMI